MFRALDPPRRRFRDSPRLILVGIAVLVAVLVAMLVAANRLYRRAAEAAGERTMASVLEELERTLVEIANSPPKLTSTDLRELRQRIAEQGILFKLRVFGSQLEAREQASARERARRTS